MKVSIVVGDLSSSGAGRWGGAVRPFLLAQALKTINCEVEMVGFIQATDEPLTLSKDIPIVSVVKQNYYPQFLKSAQELLQQINGDIIYAYKLKPTSLGVSLLKRTQTHRPVILDIDDWELSWYGGEQYQYKPSLKQLGRDILKSDGSLRQPDYPLYLKWIERLVSQANCVTLHTEFLKQRFGGIYLPNGKDTTLFDPQRYDPEASRLRYGLKGYRILMFPGAPRPYKGLEDILIALEQLNQDDIKLVIVGGSPYDEYDDQLIQRWGKWIIQLPKTPAIMMPEVVAAAHVVVVPQRDVPAAQAQFPLKLTDGMAMAKPILATKVGDIPEILGETGYLVESGSPEQIAQTLTEIFNNFGDAQAKGLQARQRCIENYSIDAMAIILEEVINKLR
ncbi:glycosyltransferase family 4 protein [Planktothrix agardhii]|jgi:glycosyltransferase involved in cell wall biosynthesis|uniref:WalN n=3 Tax=Planktothrix agardhii TaxID=1160 RepID=A0A073CI94_PLAA1|nr:glycosyltransferase family 4 protein [Planktothrix agardhii]BBD56820.1 glycosyl transferase, group 1 [Planktothrix agardhii NIES-204]KEI67418.1 WalN [Planktothrix agardhii NIVA-CYA 126/8]MBG0747069.1 glycosyltransferase family 4 protein [Planktothrix agardhii KL2]MCB8751024.1 glycosyltransferase family 4 protein [Planktothrix agardhii 1810]MCB8764475.1 glycosyltransferase family 4 protein [Planktothrix agardhii 1809]